MESRIEIGCRSDLRVGIGIQEKMWGLRGSLGEEGALGMERILAWGEGCRRVCRVWEGAVTLGGRVQWVWVVTWGRELGCGSGLGARGRVSLRSTPLGGSLPESLWDPRACSLPATAPELKAASCIAWGKGDFMYCLHPSTISHFPLAGSH